MTQAADETTHRSFSPSASGRWFSGGCTASVVIDTSQVKERRRKDADRGHKLHAVSETCLVHDRDPDPEIDEISENDAYAVQRCVDFVRERDGTKRYEYRTDLVPGLCGGTSDVVVLEPEPGVLEIIDFKFGTGYVDPEWNTQLVIYWLGVHARVADLGDFRKARLTIAQPALDHFASWDARRDELLELGEDIADVVDRVMDGEVEFKATVDNCRFCRAKTICPEQDNRVTQAARDDFFPGGESDLAEEAGRKAAAGEKLSMGEKLALVDSLRAWCKAVEGAAVGEALNGGEVEGFKLVEGRKGNRAWPEGKQKRRAAALLAEWGLDEMEIFKQTMVSPNQADDLAKKSADGDKELTRERKAELADLWEEGRPGCPTLVPEGDKREAIDKTDLARRDFSEFIDSPEDADE